MKEKTNLSYLKKNFKLILKAICRKMQFIRYENFWLQEQQITIKVIAKCLKNLKTRIINYKMGTVMYCPWKIFARKLIFIILKILIILESRLKPLK